MDRLVRGERVISATLQRPGRGRGRSGFVAPVRPGTWGWTPEKNHSVWVRIRDDGDYLYAADFSEAKPLSRPMLAERIDPADLRRRQGATAISQRIAGGPVICPRTSSCWGSTRGFSPKSRLWLSRERRHITSAADRSIALLRTD